MEAQNDPGNQVRVLNQGRNCALKQAQTPARLDTFIFPQNDTNLSKKVTFQQGWICGGHRISAGQDRTGGKHAAMVNEAMSKQASIAGE